MFIKGFEKVASFFSPGVIRAGKSAMKLAKNPTVAKNALIGAGAGAVAGAVNNKEDRLGGAVSGALTGGLGAGAATAGMKAFKANQRLGGFRQAKMNSMYANRAD